MAGNGQMATRFYLQELKLVVDFRFGRSDSSALITLITVGGYQAIEAAIEN
jgi:hypothetical protein